MTKLAGRTVASLILGALVASAQGCGSNELSGTGGGTSSTTTTTATTTTTTATTTTTTGSTSGTGGMGGAGGATSTGGTGGATSTGGGGMATGGGGGVTTGGGGMATGGSGQGGTGGAACANPANDCPPPANACRVATCVNGACGQSFVAQGQALAAQKVGDCQTAVCDGNGEVSALADNADIEDDGNACTLDSCAAGVPKHMPQPAGSACTDAQNPAAKLCDGAGSCVACLGLADCAVPNYCSAAHVCVPPACNDGLKNGSETDVDCGGAVCPKCNAGKTCMVGSDCQTNTCQAGVCFVGDCNDGAKNSSETDVDCGGPVCAKCSNGKACMVNSDCNSQVCSGMVCQAPTCSDGVKNGSETGVDCGGASCGICPVVLILGGGNVAGVLTGELHPGGGWISTLLGDATTVGPSLAITTTGTAYGLIRSEATHELRVTTWNSGAWTPFAALGPGITTREQPSIRAVGPSAQAVFHGEDFKYYYAPFPLPPSFVPEPVGAGAGQSFGPSPAQIVPSPAFPVGAVASVAFINGAAQNHLFSRDRVAAGWNAEQQVDGGATSFNLAPDVIRLIAGPELMAVWVRSNDNQVLYATRSGGVWSAAAPIPSTFSGDRVTLAALPGGAAILAFRGTDGFLYYAQYANGVWSAAAPFSSPNIAVSSSPAIARGVGSGATLATAELAFTLADGKVYASRFIAGAWTAPALVGGANMNRVAIASAP